MDTATATDLKTFRAETRAWLEANYPESLRRPVKSIEKEIYWGGRNPYFHTPDTKLWFERMYEKGWAVPHWPVEYGGGGLSKQEQKILREEMSALGCQPPIYSFGISMLGPALLKFGNDHQKMKYLNEITAGKVWWCQGYSEPGAGSDLAGLQTSAEDMGDHYLVNGQKVWTSYADSADMIFCLVRTDPEAPKHSGISFLLIDMEAEGVSTRPIKLISGKSPFCETFFDNVKVPKENLVGKLNSGWSIAKYLLTHERSMIGGVGDARKDTPLSQIAIKEVGLEDGKLADPVLRLKVAQWMMDGASFKLAVERILDEAKKGQQMGAKSSYFKYYATELNKDKHELMMELGGYDALKWGAEYDEGKLARDMCRTKANSIEGGTSEVQLNIISKRILGLPGK